LLGTAQQAYFSNCLFDAPWLHHTTHATQGHGPSC
jgi:hypothetical protein